MKKIIAIILCVAILLSLSACSLGSAQKIKKALESENGEQVNEVYKMSKDNASVLKRFDKEIASFISKAIDDINAQDFAADAERSGADAIKLYLKSEYGTLLPQEGGTDGISSSVSDENYRQWSELMNLIQSKAAYCNGIYSYKTEKDYEYAIKVFSEVEKNDSLFEKTQSLSAECADLYIKATMEKVEGYIRDNDINAGIELMKKATEYLNSNSIESGELKTKTDELLANYAKTYADKAEKAFAEHDVDVAMQNMEIALSLQPDNSDYKSKYDDYELYVPFELYTEDSYLSLEQGEDDMYYQINKDSISNSNLEMPNSFLWQPWLGVQEGGYCSITWNLGGKFNTVSGKMFVRQEGKDSGGTSYLKAYGDGKLIYTSPTIGRNVLPKDVDFDVSGIQTLKIEFVVTGYGEYGISNLVAQKDFPT